MTMVSTFIFRIAYNVFLSESRKKRPEPTEVERITTEHPADVALSEERMR